MVLAGLGSIKQSFNIAELIQPDQIIFCSESCKLGLLEKAAEHLYLLSGYSKKELLSALLEREKIVSTGLGWGVALPHARLAGIQSYSISILINETPIAWDKGQGKEVRVVFALVGPDDKQIEHLQIISSFAELIREDHSRSLLFSAKTAQQVFSILETPQSSQ